MPTSSVGRQIALLALCQALLYINNVTLTAINGLAGPALAPTLLLATLPTAAVLYTWRVRLAGASATA